MIVLLPRTEQEREQTFIKHMTAHPWWQNDIQQLRKDTGKIVVGTQEILRRHGQRLICPKCETGAYRTGKDRARCNKCGWEGKSITVDEYITEKLYRR